MDSSWTLELNATIMFCTLIIWMKFFVTIFIQGGKSIAAGTRIKEDGYMTKEEVTEEKRDADIRWKKIVQNDVENLPLAFIVFWGVKIIAIFPSSRLAMIILIPIYVAARILHTICFAIGKQWPRTIGFIIANLCVGAAGLIGSIDAFRTLGLKNGSVSL
jgi:glutathione S-transferase